MIAWIAQSLPSKPACTSRRWPRARPTAPFSSPPGREPAPRSGIKSRLSDRARRLLVGVILALLTSLGLLSVESLLRPRAIDGLYFQPWSSEKTMQTVSIEDLRKEPFRSLWHLHIQPPAFDALRALLVHVVAADKPLARLRKVDYLIYTIWTLLYGMTVFVLYWWLSDLTSIRYAALSALLFSAHPALIFYATLLETTLLSSFLILCFCYLLWRVAKGRRVPASVLAASFLSLYFTRSVFQWHWLLLLPFCLLLLRFPLRKILVFFAITSVVVGFYTAKQISLFGISSTSSFTGFNLCRSIGIENVRDHYRKKSAPAEEAPSDLPRVLTRVRKVNGAVNFNNLHYLEINRRLLQKYRREFASYSPENFALAVLYNLKIYLRPSSRYTSHLLVDRLPWRSAYDHMASFPLLPLFFLAASLFWFRRADQSSYRQAVGLAFPVALIAFISVVAERGENMRFKFFIEPVVFCFLATQAHEAGRKLVQLLRTWQGFARRRSAAGKPVLD